MATSEQLESVLHTAGEPYARLPLSREATVLITQRGGRVLGIFPAPESENLLWTNDAAFASPQHFAQFTAAGHWNLGGERMWIAPEIQYNVRDRHNFWGTMRVPPQMDPGAYTLHDATSYVEQPSVTLTMPLTLTAYTLAEGEQSLSLQRTYTPVPDPLNGLGVYADWRADVAYCGYRQVAMLSGETTTAYSETWNLVQVIAGGQLIIPCATRLEASDYFGSVPEEARQIHFGEVPYLLLSLTGNRQYKVGYKAACMTGRMGYWRPLPDGREAVLIRAFFNDPSNRYAEEPPLMPGVTGHSVHVYNDGGEFGGELSFGEMECSGTTIRASAAQDTYLLWVYIGTPAAIRQVIEVLLGVLL